MGKRAPAGWRSSEWAGRHNYECQGCPRATLNRDAVPDIQRRCARAGGPCAAQHPAPGPEPAEQPPEEPSPTPDEVIEP